MTAAGQTRPGWLSRLSAAACYLGLTPLLVLLRVRRDDPHLRHHRGQALAVWLPLLAFLLLCLAGLPLSTWLMIRFPDAYRRVMLELPQGMVIPLAVAGLWALVPLAGLALALAGSARPLPVVGRMARRRWLRCLALAGNGVLLGSAAVAAALAAHASALVREDGPAPVYLLYDNVGYEALGAWGPKLAGYRLALAAAERWGPGAAVVAPLGRRTLGQALRHGRFAVLLCHGSDGLITSRDLLVRPANSMELALGGGRPFCVLQADGSEWELPVGDGLAFVYNSACDAGRKAGRWQRCLAPAEVVTFDRPSGGIEHIWWLWADAPARLRALP
ncbi:MAG TPA: hypothetical protein VIL46_15865 [Gemmataceae bacterium]